jgi:[lysine-biosynthesis-protein LysW]--L-2-aminoadipate ligase
VLSACRALHVPALSAGIAATGDRLDVASALAAHGLPRPLTALCTSEEAAMEAVTAIGLPATLLPLDLKSPSVALLDVDAAEAILEHRSVLGGAEGMLGLIQAGSPAPERLATVVVVDGAAVALAAASGMPVADEALRLAAETARALRADLIGVVLALGGSEPAVWDVQPVPEFRHALPVTGRSVAEAIADAVQLRIETPAPILAAEREPAWLTLTREGVRGDVVISA